MDNKFTSENLDKYSLKHIKNESDLHKELEDNAHIYHGSKTHLTQSEKKSNRKLVPKKLQIKAFLYDKQGNLIGDPDDYYQEVWCEVDQEEKKEKKKDEDSDNEKQQENSDFIETKHVKEESEDVEIKKEDYSGVKSKLFITKNIKKAKFLDPETDKEKLDRRKTRVKKFAEQTKWLPNSAFTTYYGKPAFENYGRGNLKPATGGIIYGNYLKTHNVNPHRGTKTPQYKQTFNNALMYGSRMPVCEPELPRKVKEDFRLSQVFYKGLLFGFLLGFPL